MQLNYLFSNARETDGYGRWNNRLIRSLQSLGAHVCPQHTEAANMPAWMQAQLGIGWDRLTISCLPPFYLNRVPGRHWLLTMTEGSALPRGWADTILKSGVERIIVPCEHNAVVFRETGLPVHVIAGGTDPDEFPFRGDHRSYKSYESYTFLSLADRGARKGWVEVWQAFYRAFGGPEETSDVRLIIKSRPDGNDMLELIRKAEHPDPRITIIMDDMDMSEFYAMGDCFAIPSRCEGWGMPHREAAMMGLPVIVQAHAGLDDGHTHEWAFVVDGGRLEPISSHFDHIAGQWMKADVTALADMMRICYERPQTAVLWATAGARWLRDNQTWAHSAKKLIELIASTSSATGEYHGIDQ